MYSINLSCEDLGNSLHYDIHDASQGLNVWTEEQPDVVANWSLIIPNVHGTRLDDPPMLGWQLSSLQHYQQLLGWQGGEALHLNHDARWC